MRKCNIVTFYFILWFSSKGCFYSVKLVSCLTFDWIQTQFRSLLTISHDSQVFVLFFTLKISWTLPVWILDVSILRRLWLCIVVHIFAAKGVGVIDQVAEAS